MVRHIIDAQLKNHDGYFGADDNLSTLGLRDSLSVTVSIGISMSGPNIYRVLYQTHFLDIKFRLNWMGAQYRLPVSHVWRTWYTGVELGEFLQRYCIVKV
jgi:hypothetical protein